MGITDFWKPALPIGDAVWHLLSAGIALVDDPPLDEEWDPERDAARRREAPLLVFWTVGALFRERYDSDRKLRGAIRDAIRESWEDFVSEMDGVTRAGADELRVAADREYAAEAGRKGVQGITGSAFAVRCGMPEPASIEDFESWMPVMGHGFVLAYVLREQFGKLIRRHRVTA